MRVLILLLISFSSYGQISVERKSLNEGDTTSLMANSVRTWQVIVGASATPATTGAQTVVMNKSVFTITPTGACTFNASGGIAGERVTFVITTSGVTSFVLTFGTNFKSVGTLATGTTTAKVFSVSFVSTNGTLWVEEGRTIAQ